MKLLNQKQLATTLVVLGVVPFAVFTLALAGVTFPLQLPTSPALMLHVYGVIIGSFVAGLHWGIHFCKRTNDSVYLSSSFVALLLWCSMWAAGSAFGLALVLVAFALLWLVEYRFSVQRVTTAWFWKLRSTVSAVVVLCLAMSILLV
ncbi:MAG TPA: DUF3429 domain-containing protein [Pseudomonadales bacterium]